MDWLKSDLSFTYGAGRGKRVKFPLIHFDSVDFPAVPGVVVGEEFSSNLEQCSEFLGSVLWMDAVSLFLPFVASDLALTGLTGKCLCLGEGTGAIGCGLGFANIFDEIFITDLPQLEPLLEVNARLVSGGSVKALTLDWTKPLPVQLKGKCDVVIGCEVLYGNRSVWLRLLETIRGAAADRCVVYLCVTLRNQRHDLDDFRAEYLSRVFSVITEHPLSDNVVVLKAALAC